MVQTVYGDWIIRFISPDNVKYLKPDSINGLNLFAYCDNDPINKFDPSGCDAILITEYHSLGIPIVGHSVLLV